MKQQLILLIATTLVIPCQNNYYYWDLQSTKCTLYYDYSYETQDASSFQFRACKINSSQPYNQNQTLCHTHCCTNDQYTSFPNYDAVKRCVPTEQSKTIQIIVWCFLGCFLLFIITVCICGNCQRGLNRCCCDCCCYCCRQNCRNCCLSVNQSCIICCDWFCHKLGDFCCCFRSYLCNFCQSFCNKFSEYFCRYGCSFGFSQWLCDCLNGCRLCCRDLILWCCCSCCQRPRIQNIQPRLNSSSNKIEWKDQIKVNSIDSQILKWSSKSTKRKPLQTMHTQCAICLDQNTTTELFCRHTYHPNCIATWLAKRKSCPCCRLQPIYGLKIYCAQCRWRYFVCQYAFVIKYTKNIPQKCVTCLNRQKFKEENSLAELAPKQKSLNTTIVQIKAASNNNLG